MERSLITLLAGASVALAVTLAPLAHADYPWVANEGANICESLADESLATGNEGWLNMQIEMLQRDYEISRAEAVTGIRQAAANYCPKYISIVPTH